MATLTLPNRVESVRPATAFVVRTARAMKVPAAAEALIAGGADVNAVSKDGWTALRGAIDMDQDAMTRLLRGYGANSRHRQ